jgi:hypothetical protein
MRLHIYAPQIDIYEKFLSFIDQNEVFEPYFYSLSIENDVEEIPHFSIFLLNAQSANSIWVKQRIHELKTCGAHDQNFYFVIYNKETAKFSDIQLVVEDIEKSLIETIENPKIDVISLAVHEAFKNGDSRFMYFDENLSDNRTIKQIESGTANDYLFFRKYIGKDLVEKVLEDWTNSPYLLFWKNGKAKTLVTYKVPQIIIEVLNAEYKFSLIDAQNVNEFSKLQQDREIISLTMANYILNDNLKDQQFVLGNDINRKDSNYLYFDEEKYRLSKLPIEKILEKEDLVIRDIKGYPKPKTKVKDWKTEITNLSGLINVINRIGVCLE